MELRYNVIKVSDLDLELLSSSKEELSKSKGFDCFEGTTHQCLKDFGQVEHTKVCKGATYGYERTKNGVPYWVLPYPSNSLLNVTREVKGVVVSQSLNKLELESFGFDVEEEII